MPPSVGVGLKPQHYQSALGHASVETSSSRDSSQPSPGWFEVHPQNYFCAGGPPHRWLTAVRDAFPLSFHSVGLSLGSAEGLNEEELDNLARLCARYEPAAVSDHLSWSGTASNRFPDLLPVPYTHECLDHFAAQVGRAQDRLGRMIMVENPSRYLAFAHDEMDEGAFLTELCRRSGCSLLFDINNVEVSATNLGLDPVEMLDAIDPALVGEVHLAGHAREDHGGIALLIDDHGSPVTDLTWQLFAQFIERAGPKPVLVEWDTDVPEWSVLMAEVGKAQAIMAGEGARDAA
ncbi:MAG: DUF692 domain-containing protein [Sphingomonadaceae bacterium]